MSVQSLGQMACEARIMDANERASTIQCIAGHLQDALEVQREVRNFACKIMPQFAYV